MNYSNIIILSSAAMEDLKAIRTASSDQSGSEDIAGQIRRRIRSLSVFPERYELVRQEPWRAMGMHRTAAAGNGYAVYYVADTEKQIVTVIRIMK